jgi:hypothetical protein
VHLTIDPIAAVRQQASHLAQAVADIKFSDPNAPQEETLACKVISLIEQKMVGKI